MKIVMNPKTKKWVVMDFDQSNYADAVSIRDLMKHPGWQKLMDQWKLTRETLISEGKAGTKTRAKEALSSVRWAVLEGYDEARDVPFKILEAAELYEDTLDQEAKANDGNE